MATLLPFDRRAYSEYMDDMNNSEGFYVTPREDGSVIIGSVRPVVESDDHHHRRAEIAAKFAVEEQKRQQNFLKFIKIVRLNRGPTAGAMYYITMAAEDSSGEIGFYEAQVWEKLNSGFKVELFRPAPYWIKSSDKNSGNLCCISMYNLLPFMDESYIYYKCFYRKVMGVEVVEDVLGGRKAVLWFKNCQKSEEFMKMYEDKYMLSIYCR